MALQLLHKLLEITVTKVATTAYVDAVSVDDDVTGSVSGSSGSTTGNAATATALETARTIGGVSFDGTTNIDLPGVNTAGTQNTSGTASGLSATLSVATGGTGQTSYTDGQLLIGKTTGNTLSKATLTAGTNVTITNGSGAITIAATDTNTEYTAGDGLDLTGTTFSTDLKSNGGLVIESTEVAVDLGASSITGTLDETDGGTGLTSYTTGDILYASGSNTLAKLGIGSSGQTLQVSSGGIVEWATATTGDITGVTAGTALDGGGVSGTVTLNVDVNAASVVTATTTDYILIEDVTDNSTKKALISDIVSAGDITEVNTAANSGLAGGATSGAVS